MKRELTITVHLEDDAFWATVEELPGVFASGFSQAELRDSLTEAISLYLSDDDAVVRAQLVGDLVIPEPSTARSTVELALT